MPSLPHSLSVLREREYRLLFGGQLVSLLGDQMVNVALAFGVIGIGGSASDLGLVFAARAFALVASLLVGGVVADRLPRRTVLIGADVVRLASQGGLAAAFILGTPPIALVAALAAITGAATGFFNPASTGFLVSVVSPGGLQQANALRGVSSSGGRIAGPVLSAALVATVGAGWALAVDAATFAASAALLSRMRSGSERPVRDVSSSFLADFREGWDAFRSRRWLWSFVAFFAFGNLLYGALQVIGPLIAERDLGGAPAWGAIIGASGVGGVIGGVVALRVAPRRPLLVAVLAAAVLMLPAALLALGSPVTVVALGAIVAELGLMLSVTLWESTLQRHVAPEVLSRVSAYDWFGSMALTPVGLALWGPIAGALGYGNALWLAFGLNLVGVAAILGVPEVRRLPPTPVAEPAAAAARRA
ncbi:MAG TPA: MFS transporter [Baekduia sp.]|nr:MFS transporter [Baekduia sp.]